jgi:hypothetical protein
MPLVFKFVNVVSSSPSLAHLSASGLFQFSDGDIQPISTAPFLYAQAKTSLLMVKID